MKNLCSYFCLLLLYTLPVGAQHKKESPVNKVATIRSVVLQINAALPHYKKIAKIDESNWGAEGNEVNAYYQKNTLKKIGTVYYLETGKSTGEYYFDQGQLIFFYSKNVKYQMPINIKSKILLSSVEEARYYFADNSIFKIIRSTGEIASVKEMQRLALATQKEARRLQALPR